jgi:ubiquinone/menaquinone biosynthesis C-methylase UbiE
VKNNNYKDSKNGKKIHYKNVKKYFRKSALEKTDFYNFKSDERVERELKKRNMWKIYTSTLKEILQNNQKISNVIDVACGMGNFTIELSKYEQFRKIIGIDFLKETFNIAIKAEDKFSNISFFQGNLLNLPFKNKSFDLTICLNTLHHIYKNDFERAIDELSRITNRVLMIEIRNKNYILSNWKTNIVLPKLYSNLPINTNSINEINKLMKKNRFKLKMIKGSSLLSRTSWRLVAIFERV